LQHPLGVVAFGDKILIADTYNHKIKELDPKSRTVRSFLGTGHPGQTDGPRPSFYEPAGLSLANGHLYIADTNNHAVRVVDLKTKRTSTLRIKDLQPPAASTSVELASGAPEPNSEAVELAPQHLRAASGGSLIVNVDLPAGYHLNPAAPQRYRVSIEAGPDQLALGSDPVPGDNGRGDVVARSSKDLQLPLQVPFHTLAPGSAELRIQLTLFYCREDNTGTCRIKTLVWRAPIEVTNEPSAANEINLRGKITSE
jgi:hypothetical protein